MLSAILASITIVFIPVGGNIPNLGDCGGYYAGGYVEDTSTVYVCLSSNERQVEFVKWHEVGHHYWFKFMTQKQRDSYKKLYERDIKRWAKFYREYGKTSVVEDFADNFAVVVTKNRHKNTRLFFIRKLIIQNSKTTEKDL
jgi:hypothetical protein